jgi:Carboxypeptidase regulatory-like domain
MKKVQTLVFILTMCLFSQILVNAQNIFSGERVQVVGSFNGYVTTPYGTDYRTTTYRRVTTTSGTPTDGRGQWTTTINLQSSGGDATPINMPGGGGNGFLFISGPAANRFLNKWVFSGVGQGNVDSVNGISAFNSGNDMGLNMSTAGYYTFVFNDCGYTQTNARYYVGYTTNLPVTVTRSSQSATATTATVNITTNVMPSPQEKIYVRYTTGADFSGAGTSTTVQATGSGTSYTANFPLGGVTNRYYVFTSTLSLAQVSLADADFFSPTATEAEKNLSVLKFDDNSGTNYSVFAPTAAQATVSGRVINSFGRGLARVRIAVTNQQGETRFASTNQFGYYRIGELNTGETYIFELRSKTYQFNPLVLTITDNLDNLDFVAQ